MESKDEVDVNRSLLVLGSVLALLSVGIGAFGAHGLKDLLAELGTADTFETAVRYQFYHTFGLLLLAVVRPQLPKAKVVWVARLFGLGIFIFSGSLYVLCLTGIKWLGAITPMGGLSFMLGWGLLALAAFQAKRG